MKNKLNVEYRLIQLTKRLLDDDELEQLSNAGAYGIGSEKRLIIEADEGNHRTGVSDFASRIHRWENWQNCLLDSITVIQFPLQKLFS